MNTMIPAARLLLAALFFILSFAAIAEEAAPPSRSSPSYLLEPKGCAILVGGSVGSSFAEPDVAGLWHDVNKGISDYFHQDLVLEKYRVVRLTVSVAQAPDISNIVVQAMARQRCSRIFQISNDVGEDNEGKYFGFIVSLLRVVPKDSVGTDGTNSVTQSEYTRRYRYPRDSATMDKFRTGTFAHTAFADIKAAGALLPLANQ